MTTILQVISAPAAGGAEVYVRDLSVALRKLGHDVHIAFVSRAVDIGRDETFERDFLASLDRHGIRWFVIGHNARRYLWIGMARMLAYCARNRISIIHSHLVYGVLLGFFVPLPIFLTEHSVRVRGPVMLRRLLKWRVKEHVAISPQCAFALKSALNVEPRVIANGVDQSRFPWCPKSSSSLRCELVAVGRISKPKNYGLMISTISSLPAHIKGRVRLRIVGDGVEDDVRALKRHIDREQLGGIVELLGARNDVTEIMHSADLLIMTSKWEGLPITLIEAAMCGLPFVATDVGGCREIAQNTGGGLIVPPDDVVSLIEAVSFLVENPTQRSQIAAASFNSREFYTIETAARSHEVLYETTRNVA